MYGVKSQSTEPEFVILEKKKKSMCRIVMLECIGFFWVFFFQALKIQILLTFYSIYILFITIIKQTNTYIHNYF